MPRGPESIKTPANPGRRIQATEGHGTSHRGRYYGRGFDVPAIRDGSLPCEEVSRREGHEIELYFLWRVLRDETDRIEMYAIIGKEMGFWSVFQV